MLDAGMQAQGKAHIARVLGRPKQSSPKILWSVTAFLVMAGAVSYFTWPSAPGDDQLGRLAILSSCEVHTPGQAWLEARSAAGADGTVLSSSQRRAAMDYLLGDRAGGVCNDSGSDNDNGEALTFTESD